MNRRSILPAIALLIIASPMTAPVEAQGLVDRRPRDKHRIESRGMSKDEAARQAEQRFGARVVKAETINDGDRVVYQFRLLNSEGKVWNVRVDAATGRMY